MPGVRWGLEQGGPGSSPSLLPLTQMCFPESAYSKLSVSPSLGSHLGLWLKENTEHSLLMAFGSARLNGLENRTQRQSRARASKATHSLRLPTSLRALEAPQASWEPGQISLVSLNMTQGMACASGGLPVLKLLMY